MESKPIPKNVTLPPIDKKALSNDDTNKQTQSNDRNQVKDNTNRKLEIIEEETKNYIDDMKKGSYNILVAVRCRPLNQRERELSNYETIKIMDNKMVILLDPIEYNGPNTVFKNRTREQTLAFDFAFDKFSTQTQIFESTTKFLLEGVVNGYNATVFAYGATGAGKTYTMLGNDENPGIMPLTLMELFKKIHEYSNDREYSIKMWYLEIYNENIRDLLKATSTASNANSNEEYLELREDPSKGIVVSGITELTVTSCKDILKTLKKGNKNRTQEATGANETSSRSHAILQVMVEYKDRTTGIDVEFRYGKLSLIDLAGSERASATMNRGIRLIEGANINRSLLTLGNCINALCEASIKGTKPYVPYRDSKLTRLLKDSLGGNARTVMIANVAPSINTFDDTYNTLKYANRAKNIKTNVQRNVLNAQYHISNYVNIINNLKNEISELKMRLGERGISAPCRELNGVTQQNVPQSNPMSDNSKFAKIAEDLKSLCTKELQMKKNILNGQIEVNKLLEIIANSPSNENDISHCSGVNGENLNDLSVVNNNLNQTEIIDTNNPKDKLEKFQANINVSNDRLKEYGKMIDRALQNAVNETNSKMQSDYLNAIVKSNKAQIDLYDASYQTNYLRSQGEIKDEYIKMLEYQLKLRDEFFVENNINLYAKNSNFKTIAEMKSEFKKKCPKVETYLKPAQRGKILPPMNYNYKSTNNIKSNYNSAYSIGRYNHYLSKRRNMSPKLRPYENYSYNNNNLSVKKNSMVRNYSQNFQKVKGATEITTPIKNQKITNFHQRHNSISNNQKCASSRGSRRNISAIRINRGKTKEGSTNNILKSNNRDNSITQGGESSLLDDGMKNRFVLGTEASPSRGRILTINQMQLQQIKKNELNVLLNAKNKKRQQLLDKANERKNDYL